MISSHKASPNANAPFGGVLARKESTTHMLFSIDDRSKAFRRERQLFVRSSAQTGPAISLPSLCTRFKHRVG
jgi:hypothetical protein